MVYLKHVSDVYMLIEGKKSINAEKNENIELTHCRLQSGFKIVTENRGSGWGLVSSVIWPFFLMFSVKMGKILMLSV